MAKSEYGEVHHDSNVCQPTPLEKKPTEVELPETLKWRHFIVSKVILFITFLPKVKLPETLKWRHFTVATFILSSFLPTVRCVLVETPLNEAVMVGSDPVEFKCKSDHGFKLKWFTHQNQAKQILFDGYSISKEAESFCSVENKVPGEFYLNLTAIHEAARTYFCLEPGTTKESSADLIVIEREAQCKIDASNSHVIMTCDLEFRGNWAPELEWRYNGTLITEGVNASFVSNKTVFSTLTVPLSTNDRNYTCTTKFDIGGKPHWTTSDNIPDYVSDSVLRVKASQIFSVKPEAHFSASEKSVVGLAIGLAIAITVIVVIIIFIYLKKRKKCRRNEEAPDVGEPLADYAA